MVCNQTTTETHVYHCCHLLDEKKAACIRVLHVKPVSSITDYFILANGVAHPHLKSLCDALEENLKEQSIPVIGVEKESESGWAVIDAFDFMVHLFLPAQRDFYQLDALWKDAEELDWEKQHAACRLPLEKAVSQPRDTRVSDVSFTVPPLFTKKSL